MRFSLTNALLARKTLTGPRSRWASVRGYLQETAPYWALPRSPDRPYDTVMARKNVMDDRTGSPEPDPRWLELSWDDLEAWAGRRSVERGRRYQKQGRVVQLAISSDHRLLATVTGSERYTTSVWFGGDEDDKAITGNDSPLRSACTCPVGYSGCKHAVAVVAAYLDQLNQDKPVPLAEESDPRWQKLKSHNRDDGDDDDAEADPDEPAADRKTNAKPTKWDEKIRQHIQAQSRTELVALVCQLVDRYPDLKDEMRERVALSDGDTERLIAQARKEIRRVTAEEAWRNGWTSEGSLPDYSKVMHRLERLTQAGHADAVVGLGRELIERGLEQIERSHDEGETLTVLGECMPVVFEALRTSSLEPAAKILYAIDAHLADDFDMIGNAAHDVLNEKVAPEVWSEVADQLARRLSVRPNEQRALGDDDHGRRFMDDYKRDRLSSWLGMALERAGRVEELVSVYRDEARRTKSYVRLVTFLIDQKRYDEAHRWATEGIEKTSKNLPGIASQLAEQLCGMASTTKQWDVVAAHAACSFFERPNVESFKALTTASAKVRAEKAVEKFALRFLETGIRPVSVSQPAKGKTRVVADPQWPLPTPEYLIPLLRIDDARKGPHFGVLINLAIANQQPDEALKWYDRWRCASKPASSYYAFSGAETYADSVAAAISTSHPERAIEIYRARIDRHLPQASTSAYETVAQYLRKLRPIHKAIGHPDAWTRLIQDIREQYRNRPRFMEILDRLEDRPIASSAGRHRKR